MRKRLRASGAHTEPENPNFGYLRLCFEQGIPSDLSVPDHITAAYGFELYRQEYGDSDDPHGTDWKHLWEFVRAVKAHPELREASSANALRQVEAVFSCWADTDKDAWGTHFGLCADEARAAFVSHWGKIRCLPDTGPLGYAFERARRHPILFGKDDLCCPSAKYERFLSLAGWLQVTSGADSIYLPTRKLGGLFGVAPMTVSRWRQFGVSDGFLTLVSDHAFRSTGGSKATEFRFHVERIPMLQDAARKC